MVSHGRWSRGDLEAAVAATRERRAVARELRDRNGEAGSSFFLAMQLIDGGRLAEAERELGEPFLAGRRGELANHAHALARVALERGELARARAGYEAEERAAF